MTVILKMETAAPQAALLKQATNAMERSANALLPAATALFPAPKPAMTATPIPVTAVPASAVLNLAIAAKAHQALAWKSPPAATANAAATKRVMTEILSMVTAAAKNVPLSRNYSYSLTSKFDSGHQRIKL